MSGPTQEQIADAIEILSMCAPIIEVQGGMWFGRNLNFADATFVDYGACRAFAVAARALPVLVERQAALVKALQESRSTLAALDHPNGRDSGLDMIRAGKPISEVIYYALASIKEPS